VLAQVRPLIGRQLELSQAGTAAAHGSSLHGSSQGSLGHVYVPRHCRKV
jgi:hypothetical protein